MVTALSADDILSRFLFYQGDVDWDKGVVKSSVFSKKHPSGFSVYRTTALCQPRIKALGKKYVEPSFLRQENPRPMLGYFDLSVSLYWKGLSSNTTLHHAPDPHPRHYNVYGMPIPAAQLGHELNLRQTMTKAAKLFRF
jgi:hypothetical protein